MKIENVKIYRIINGDEVIAEGIPIAHGDTKYDENIGMVWKNALLIMQQPKEDRNVSIAFVPYFPMSKNDEVPVSKKFMRDMISFSYEPQEQVLKFYQEKFSTIIKPNTQLQKAARQVLLKG